MPEHKAILPTGLTVRVLTLKGLVDLREKLKGPDADKVFGEYRDTYFRDQHGALVRVFPKGRR